MEQGLTVKMDLENFSEADNLGIPYSIILKESSLTDGVVQIRDRETDWFEQIHVNFVVQKLAKWCLGKDVEDTLNKLKKELGLGATTSSKTGAKQKKVKKGAQVSN